MRHVCLLIVLVVAAPAAADTFESVGMTSSPLTFFHHPVGVAADAMGGGMAAAWDEPGSSAWGPAAPETAEDGVDAAWTVQSYLIYDRTSWALRAAWKRLTLSVVLDDWDTDPIPIRTAYQPEGTGETFEFDVGTQTAALSVAALRQEGARGMTALSLGAGLRRYDYRLTDLELDLVDADMGALIAFRAHDPRAQGLRAWCVGAAATSVFGSDAEAVSPEGEASLELHATGVLRFGGRVEYVPTAAVEGGRTVLAVTAVLDGQQSRFEGVSGDWGWQAGVEALWLEAFAFRYGVQDLDAGFGVIREGTSFGFGLRHDLLDGRLHLRADMAVLDLKDSLSQDTLELYSLRAGWTF